MLLILTEEADYSSSLVIDWLLYFNVKFIRINENDVLEVEYLLNDIKIKNNNFCFLISDLKCVWYRRGFLNIKVEKINDSILDNFKNFEFNKLNENLYYKLSLLPNINNYLNSDVNKLIVNDIAKKIGLTVPEEYIINSKSELSKLNNYEEYSTKSITGSTILNYDNFYYIGYTTLLDRINNYSDSFFPSLIQKYIKKKYELRIFYLHRKFYSMAIFSQKDKKTEIDFRKYNRENPNRNVPFELPEEIKDKLTTLMQKLNLNSGSIDMILSLENEFVFLEVNPIGQFGMVSEPCNYNLYRKIAEFFNTKYYE
jgi:ATP-GRASP peptide maturase of grasp-with-spasm system